MVYDINEDQWFWYVCVYVGVLSGVCGEVGYVFSVYNKNSSKANEIKSKAIPRKVYKIMNPRGNLWIRGGSLMDNA